MKVARVGKMTPQGRFFYWIRERHNVYLRRKAGKPKPWTDDEVLQNYFFTNPFRENDKTTVWFRDNIRYPLRNSPNVMMATVIFRWFNRIPTGELLLDKGLFRQWDKRRAVKLLYSMDPPVFTGAYMIKAGNGPPGCKIRNVCEAIDNVWLEQDRLVAVAEETNTLRDTWKELKRFPHLGPFMSYEIVTDLRHTYLLENAEDILTWANPGPGARRGLNRILQRRPLRKPITDVWEKESQKLLRKAQMKFPEIGERIEMREIEHSLCEFDKYERARTEEGKLKRRYKGR